MKLLHALLGASALLVIALWPTLAIACPSCGGRQSPGWGIWAAVGGMILVPYAVALVAVRVLRRLDR